VLLEREILESQQLHDYLDRVNKPPLLANWLQTGMVDSDSQVKESISLTSNGFSPRSKYLHENLT
jgi:hypothetical protein